MKNKNVGYLILGIAILMAVIVYIFNQAMKSLIEQSCTMGIACTMYDTANTQMNLSLAVIGLVLLIGIFLIFSKETERIIIKKIKERNKKKQFDLQGLDTTEKKLISILRREQGAFFQKSLMEELTVGKVKMTRMLDKLEAKQFITRKRRGMNNIVVLNE